LKWLVSIVASYGTISHVVIYASDAGQVLFHNGESQLTLYFCSQYLYENSYGLPWKHLQKPPCRGFAAA
jgi:hypothetical protein